MKHYIKYIVGFCVLPLLFASCLNDDFLEKSPRTSFTPENTLVSYSNFKTYAWGLYNISEFDRYPYGGGDPDPNRVGYGNPDDPNIFVNDWYAGFMVNGNGNGESPWAYQNVTESGFSGNWNYEYIRRVNVMLDHIDRSQMSDKDKAHWRSVGYFFRSLRYFSMMSSFGDIVWEEHEVKSDDTEALYASRTPRDTVASRILKNLQYAETNINPDGDGANTINTKVVKALISRFGLFEGTWRKYHALNDANVYLQASLKASQDLVAAYPTLHDNYNEEFNSLDLSKISGIILYKAYIENMTQNLTRYARTASAKYELSQMAINTYLCSDGTVITKTRPNDVKDTYNQFKNRDRRLYYVVCPPYRIKAGNGLSMTVNNFTPFKVGETIATGTSKVLKVETPSDSIRLVQFIDMINKLTRNGLEEKPLPIANWSDSQVKSMPHFKDYNEGQGFLSSYSGYMNWKLYNRHGSPTVFGVNTEDAPIFRMAEVLVNYAEAAYELGQFNQSVADATINKLRTRAGVSPMNVSQITSDFDPDRDQTVNPVLWEIRRERRIELMADGFAFDDIRRWKVAPFYVNKRQLGMWVDNADYGNKLVIYPEKSAAASANKVGNIAYPVNEPKGWLDHYYLYPLPMDELVKNKNLKQNPGYKSPTS